MTNRWNRGALVIVGVLSSFALVAARAAQEGEPPRGPFGYSRLTTADGQPASIDDFYLSQDCALCHPRQWEEMRGSMRK